MIFGPIILICFIKCLINSDRTSPWLCIYWNSSQAFFLVVWWSKNCAHVKFKEFDSFLFEVNSVKSFLNSAKMLSNDVENSAIVVLTRKYFFRVLKFPADVNTSPKIPNSLKQILFHVFTFKCFFDPKLLFIAHRCMFFVFAARASLECMVHQLTFEC